MNLRPASCKGVNGNGSPEKTVIRNPEMGVPSGTGSALENGGVNTDDKMIASPAGRKQKSGQEQG